MKKERKVKLNHLLDFFHNDVTDTVLLIEELRQNDNYDKTRLEEARTLTQLVQDKIFENQNPSDCGAAKFLVCPSMENALLCGFTCTLHYITECLIIAFATRRTLLLDENRI